MSKYKLADHISRHALIQRRASAMAVRALLSFITQELQAGRAVSFQQFGTFSLTHRRGRVVKLKGSMVVTGPGKYEWQDNTVEREYPSADYVKFKPSPTLKRAIWQVRPRVYRKKV